MSIAVSIPKPAELSVKLEFRSEVNITPFAAKQRVDDYLLNEVGNLLHADEPELFMDAEGIFWRTPVAYSVPSRGRLGTVGVLLVDVQTGRIHRSETESQEMLRNVETLSRASSSEAG
ncbi:MAG: hypothetical protein AUJ92_13745 [Armatimonadetes bacterium CG2_30_59_28]|nr:hypothetical protein [Armatimonadota bacterium]OIO92639.1 MAG: hypothetical protein AUJ92_13745 [Armatimonadetes bacterium CG2_30_59_28]PIU66821.1 MAG: hypothetical protein COS85_03150 [Armatimonadetes bacterium CG07_land_8_20_14_0_80_59_28]PJB67549.1 MAG: hypothetical protein CO095_12050 [Armatimonadetes bacterium CG_4_9_14_3_um_filter_58_7]